MAKRYVYVASLVLFFVVSLVFGELLICGKCGHENDSGAMVCNHCGAAFAARGRSGAVETGEAEKSDIGYLSARYVEDEIAEGRKYIQGEEYELGRLFFLNALALEGLTNPEGHGSRSVQLLELIQAADTASRHVRKACPRCNGSGQQPVEFEGLTPSGTGSALGGGRAFSATGSSGVKCRKCDGTGSVSAMGTIDEMKFVRGQAASAYRQYQQARRYEPLGGAWVPTQLVDTFTVRQKAAVMRSIVLPCDTCAGYGRSDCKSCGGIGRIACRNCTNGRVPLERMDGRVQRIGADRTKECEVCTGSGTLPCKGCGEEGTIVCKRCNGSGEATVCRGCAGSGYLTCKKCNGTKIYREEACPACKEEGVTLCTSCKGCGRRN